MISNKRKAIRKLEKAIDCLVDVQDLGEGCTAVSNALESLNHMVGRLNYEIQNGR